ncbi:hypothetical protein ADUPG1_002691, partial [Aduncisulcus paluster]
MIPTDDGGAYLDLFYIPIRTRQKIKKEEIHNTVADVFEVIHSDVSTSEEIFEEIAERLTDVPSYWTGYAPEKEIEMDHIDLNTKDIHGHYDHGNGLSYLINKELVCHVGCFVERYRKKDNTSIGLPLTLKQAQKRFTLRMSDSPVELYDNVYFMGGVPRVFDFEKAPAFSVLKDGTDDPILDDSAIVVKSAYGNIIITGCSHSGICNIIERATNITRDVRTYAIIGGLHLKEVDDRVKET